MLRFKPFKNSILTEATKKEAPGILHIEHPSDRLFDGTKEANHALKTLRGVALSRTPVTRKIDDKMSFQAIRDESGRVGVKYKGTGSKYNFSNDDIERQHGHKPYLAEPLKALLAHTHKVLPNKAGEYQGGFMSTPENRTEKGGHIKHTPNTISYSVKKDSPEGKKLAQSKVSMTIHSELVGAKKKAKPILDQSSFRNHPDVHLVGHTVSKEEQKLSPADKKTVLTHISKAQNLLKDHDHGHLAGHSETLRRYINSTVDSGEKPSVEGYRAHLGLAHDKKIEKLKTEKARAAKTETKNAALAHIETHGDKFRKSLQIHGHLQAATNALARSLNRTAHGGYKHHIGDKESGPEGFVANGLKIVDREDFSKANRAKGSLLKAKK
jgi:hypothetical protein